MPRFLAPVLSGVHRHACLSLYRALLQQCSRPWLSDEKASDIRKLITVRFRKDKSLQSPSKITGSLNAGYEALDLLDSCSQGNKESTNRLDNLLPQSQDFLAKQRRREAARKAFAKAQEAAEPQPEHKPTPILSRPWPKVSGIRHIPRLVSARGVPYLRIKKPQPEVLSRTIRGKLNTRIKRTERRQRLEEELLWAKEEDMWDELVGQKEKASYWLPVNSALSEVHKQIVDSDQKNLDLARKMWKVVLKEKESAEKEKAEREMKAAAFK